MQTIRELSHHASPGGRPQALAVHDGTLWIAARDTKRLYAVDREAWRVLEEIELPGEPFGLASFDGALHVVVSIGEDDDRYLYRVAPGRPFDEAAKTACPGMTGSTLASDGTSLYLVQAHFGKILQIGTDGSTAREIELPARCAGLGFGPDGAAMIEADDEFDVLRFGSLSLDGSTATFTPVAGISADARGLAYDGKNWWTDYRDPGTIVSFTTGA